MDFPGSPTAKVDQIDLMFARLVDDLSSCHARRAALIASPHDRAEALNEANTAVDEAEAALVESMRKYVVTPKSPGEWAYLGCRGVRVGGDLFILIEPGCVESVESERIVIVPLGAIRGLM